jgi:hypothetical protein
LFQHIEGKERRREEEYMRAKVKGEEGAERASLVGSHPFFLLARPFYKNVVKKGRW